MKCPVGSTVSIPAGKVLTREEGPAWFGPEWRTQQLKGKVLRTEGHKVVVLWEHDEHHVEKSHGPRALSSVPAFGPVPVVGAAEAEGAAAAPLSAAKRPPPPPPLPPAAVVGGAAASGDVAAGGALATTQAPTGRPVRVNARPGDDDEELQDNPLDFAETDEEDANEERQQDLLDAREHGAGEVEIPAPAAATRVEAHGVIWTMVQRVDEVPNIPFNPEWVRFSEAPPPGRVGVNAAGDHDPYDALFTVGGTFMEAIHGNVAQELTFREVQNCVAIMICMSDSGVAGAHRRLWSAPDAAVDPYGVMWWPQFGQYVARQKFEYFLSNALGAGPAPHNMWERVKLIEKLFNNSTSVFKIGNNLTVDESMAWCWAQETFKEAYNAGYRRPGAVPPGQFVKEKPIPKGYWHYALAAFYTSSPVPTLLKLEPRSSPDPDPPEFPGGLGVMTRAVLRAVWEFRGSWRTVYADSAYASAELAIELFKIGLYFAGVVKTNTVKFPKKYLQEVGEGLRRGEHRVMTSTMNVMMLDGEQHVARTLTLRAVVWVDRKVFTFIATRGSTDPGALIRRKRWNPNQGFFVKEVARPKIVEELHDSFGAVDLHNRYRQAGYAFEALFRTANFEKRIFCFLVGALLTNAYAAWVWDRRNCRDMDLSRAAFNRTLMQQLFAGGGMIQASTLRTCRSPTLSLTSFATPPHQRGRSENVGAAAAVGMTHTTAPLRTLVRYANLDPGKKAQITCTRCKRKTTTFCVECSSEERGVMGLHVECVREHMEDLKT